MTELEQELLNLAGELRGSRTLADRREVRGGIEALASQVRVLDPEQPTQEAVRRLYYYLDARTAAAVDVGVAALRAECIEIECRLLEAIHEFRRSDGGMEIAVHEAAMSGLYERIAGLEGGSAEQWMLARLYEYAAWQRREANQRWYKQMTRRPAPSRTRGRGPGVTPYRAPRSLNRTRGFER